MGKKTKGTSGHVTSAVTRLCGSLEPWKISRLSICPHHGHRRMKVAGDGSTACDWRSITGLGGAGIRGARPPRGGDISTLRLADEPPVR